ncbi:nucleotidyltransferase family protein, partial [Motilibacter deserti]
RGGAREFADAYAGLSLPALADEARAHSIAPLLATAMRADPLLAGSGLVPLLTGDQRSAFIHHAVGLERATRCDAALTAAGIPFAVVKGPVLTELAYRAPDRRWYGDVDLLISPGSFERALDVLEEAGARLVDLNWTLAGRQIRGELSMVLDEVPLDVHWHLVNDRRRRQRMPIDTDELLSRVRRVTVGQTTLPALEPTDGLIQLAQHAALSGGTRLGWLADIALWLQHSEVDADETARRAARWGVLPLVGTILDRTERVIGPLGLTVPGARGWRQLVRAADAWRPPGRPHTDHLSWRSLVAATGPSTAASVGELGRVAVLDGVLGAMERRRVRSAGRSGPNPLHVVAGGEAARRAYFDAVRSEARSRLGVPTG